MKKRCLICVDVQNDFCPGGALAVGKGDEVVPVINKLLPNFDLVVFTMDWHKADNVGFASQYGVEPFTVVPRLNDTVWPDHCVQNTEGAKLHPGLDLSKCKKDFYIYKKGEENHPYSAFRDYADDRQDWPELVNILDQKEVDEIYVCGLAGDYCCKDTALDGVEYGFKVSFIMDGVRFINDPRETIVELEAANVKLIDSSNLAFL